MEKEMSMRDIIKELGYGCTIKAAHGKEILSLYLPLTEMTISRILGAITRTYVSLEDYQTTFSTFRVALGCSNSLDLPTLSSCNIDVLIKTIKQLITRGSTFPMKQHYLFSCLYINIHARNHFLSMPYVGLCGRIFKVSYHFKICCRCTAGSIYSPLTSMTIC
ncbi:uncharacterized protein LOC120193065 [Hibiscus syriacus]|uniref:uncharacterized protein LOC120193065 n=1 Tax=Hibiscus syriacus TaxID=106335 RepID=UPI001921B53E|nr:uncharacterized protein LOC120193065 [Hibiscus syriacus]